MNEGDIKKIVSEHNGGPIEEVHGPYRINGFDVWEVWTKPNGRYETRFVVSKPGTQLQYRDAFGSLALEMESEHAKARKLSNIMAAIGFLTGLGLLGYIVIAQKATGGEALALVTTLLASAGTYYYGTWKSS